MTLETQHQCEDEQCYNGDVAVASPEQRKENSQSAGDILLPQYSSTNNDTSVSSDAMLGEDSSFPDRHMLYLPVKLGNKPINALVDTSSTVNYIRPEAVPSGTRYESVEAKVIDSARYIFPITCACYLDTEIDGKIYKVFYLVFENMSNMLILGIDWMEEYLVKISFGPACLSFDNKMLELTKVSTCEFAETYYGQTDFDLWLPERPPFYWAYLDKISDETVLETEDVYYQLKNQLLESPKQIEVYEDTNTLYMIYEANRRPRVYVPSRLRVRIFNRFHSTPDDTHLSADDTWQSIRVHYYWPEMREEIHNAVHNCSACRVKQTQLTDISIGGVSIKKEIEIASECKNALPICKDYAKMNPTRRYRDAKMLYLPVKLDGKSINVFIDSGATKNLIRLEAVPEAMRSVYSKSESCCYLDTEISGKTYKIYYLISEDACTMVTFGLDWMEEYNVSIDVVMPNVTFDDRTLKLTLIDCNDTYYGQTDFDLWRPVFFMKYLYDIRRETELDNGNELAELFSSEQRFRYNEGVYEVIEDRQRPRIYVPLKLRAEIINKFHLKPNGKHYSAAETWEQTRDHYYWPLMRLEIHNFVRNCGACRDERIRLAYANIGEPALVHIRIKLSVESLSEDKHIQLSGKTRASSPVHTDNAKRRRKVSVINSNENVL